MVKTIDRFFAALAVLATIILMMPWILGTLREYTATLFQNLAAYGLHG